jgi:hypothetical protein
MAIASTCGELDRAVYQLGKSRRPQIRKGDQVFHGHRPFSGKGKKGGRLIFLSDFVHFGHDSILKVTIVIVGSVIR